MSKLKEKGITLVALVVTIIILLILAGVTIAQISGNNGLFSRVRQAVDKYKNASIEEQLAILEVEKYVSDFTVSEEEGVLVKITKVEVTAGTDTITINVTVEGNVSKIEYSKDNEDTWQVKEGNDKSTEYIYEKVAPGSYFIKVRATDEKGKTTTATSDVVTVTPETTADEEDVLEGETFLKAGETKPRTGTMQNQGDLNKTVTAGGSLPLPAGYYSAGTITTTNPQGEFDMELLWTNPNPSVAFAAQTVTISGLNKYKMVGIRVICEGTRLDDWGGTDNLFF